MANPTTDSMMYITMHRQPDDLRRLAAEGWAQAAAGAAAVSSAQRVFLTGIGTSYHAALTGAWLLRAAGLDARAISSFDLALYDEQLPLRDTDAVIVLAHTGVKRFSSEAMARAGASGATVISIGSSTAVHPGSSLILRTIEPEQSAAYTSSHLCAMYVLAQIATVLGEQRQSRATAGFRAALEALPDQVAAVLSREGEIEPVAREAIQRKVYAIGGGPNEATALELVIKAREAAYANVDGLAAEQFLHGPMVAFEASDLAVIVNPPGRASARVAEISAVASAIGGRVWLVGSAAAGAPDATVFSLPELPELVSPLLAVVPMQILAYQMAELTGAHPDTFRCNEPTYDAAFSLLEL